MRERRNEAATDAMRITTQFRVREGMAYELREQGTRLTLLIKATGQDDDAAKWSCEASTGDLTPITQSGATKSEALRRTCEAWTADGPEKGLPRFDWEAVTRALEKVRAI